MNGFQTTSWWLIHNKVLLLEFNYLYQWVEGGIGIIYNRQFILDSIIISIATGLLTDAWYEKFVKIERKK